MPSANLFVTTWDYAGIDQAGQTPATVGGGSWTGQDGLDYFGADCVQTRILKDVARTTDTDPASSVLEFTLDQPQLLQSCVLLGHNLTSYAKWRWSGYDDANFSAPHAGADNGFIDVYPGYIPWTQLSAEMPNWLSAKPDMTTMDRMPRVSYDIWSQPRFVKYNKIEIVDEFNPDGCIDVGQVMLTAPILQTKVNILYGSNWGFNSETKYILSKGGVKFFDFDYPYRVLGLQFAYLSAAEAFLFQEMHRRLGKDREFFVSVFPTDLINRQYFSFRCNFETLSRVTWKSYNNNEFATELREAL